MERVEVITYINSMHGDDSVVDDNNNRDDIIADCNVTIVQLNMIYLRKSLSTHMYLKKPGERRASSRAADEGHGRRGRGGKERQSQGGLDEDYGGGDEDNHHEIVTR